MNPMEETMGVSDAKKFGRVEFDDVSNNEVNN